MKKIIRLTESDLLRIIKKVIKEQESKDNKFEYYFEKEGHYPNERKEKQIFIKRNTQEVYYYDNEGKLINSNLVIPYKTEIGFNKENKPNQSLITANKLSGIFNSTATKIEQFNHEDPYNYKIDIVFIDNDNIPKKGKIKLNPEPKEKGKIYIPIQISTPVDARKVPPELSQELSKNN